MRDTKPLHLVAGGELIKKGGANNESDYFLEYR